MTATPPSDDGLHELTIEIVDELGRTLDTIYVTEITGREATPTKERRITRPNQNRRGG